MAGYSGASLARKLGITDDTTILVIGAPRQYSALLAPLPGGARITSRASRHPRFAHLFTTSRADLVLRLRRLRGAIAQDGVVWVSWPKKAAQMETDVTEDVIRAVALPLGFVDVKVCAVDDTWSGLKLVIRKELRTL